MPWAAAGAIGGALISANAAGDAADSQSASSDQANQLRAMQQAQVRADLAPWTQAGGAAQNRLSQYLGLGGVGSSGVTSMGLATGLSPDQVRQQLLSRYTTSTTAPAGAADATRYANDNNYQSMIRMGMAPEQAAALMQQSAGNDALRDTPWTGGPDRPMPLQPGQGGGTASQIDEAGLNAAIAKYYEEQDAQNAAAAKDPTYGSLLRPYRNGEEFSFTGKDLATDPGYKFGLDQGTQGIERGQASRGNFLSGGAMKELARYNEDYAGTKFNEGFGRAQSTWNTNLGAFNQNRNTIYSFLTGQSLIGQNSAVQVGSSGNQAAAAMGDNITSAGTARSAGQVAGGNALQSGVNSLVNLYNTNNPSTASGWNSLLSSGGGGYSGYTGYVGGKDPIANLNTSQGWTA
jgi:hypothetical protein